MCSISDDTDELLFMTQDNAKRGSLSSAICIKCQGKATISLQKRNSYCIDCVIQSINHKFRATLGKSRLIKPDQPVLVAHSGGKCSSVLLHLLSKGLSDTTHKKLRLRVLIIYIDDGIIRNWSSEQRLNVGISIRKQAESYDFDLHVRSLSEAMVNNDLGKTNETDMCYDSKLQSYLNSIKSETSRIDMVEQMKNWLIFDYAKKLGCPFVFVADHSPKLASKLLSNACLGRGSQLSYNGFVDNRCDGVVLLRPMKDITQEELEIYVTTHSIARPVSSDVDSSNSNQMSIQNTIQKFVNDLQNNYPATISTIQKSGEKLGVVCNSPGSEVCIICQSSLDTDIVQSSALQATKFSKKISLLGPTNTGDNESENENILQPTNAGGDVPEDIELCGQSRDCGCKKDIALSRQHIDGFLCYGCKRTLSDATDLSKIPYHITKEVRSKIALAKIEDEIKDFLL